MIKRVASAPGKLVVAGEYSVLEASPAWVTAVGRRALCTLTIEDPLISDQAANATLQCKGRIDANVTLKKGFPPSIGGQDAAFFDLAAQVLQALFDAELLPTKCTFVLDSSSMATVSDANGSAVKLGLGSSAAITAAMVRAVAPALDAKRRHQIADDAHSVFSGGQGSGVDVAASSFGGDFVFTRTLEAVRVEPLVVARDDIAMLPVFVGHAQNTRTFLAHVNALKRNDRNAYDACMNALATSSADLIAAARTTAINIFDAVEACRKAMGDLGRAASIDIVSAPHQRAAHVAHAFGGAAKPSGAGGGDVAFVFVPTAAEERARQALSEEGLAPLELLTGVEGARLEVDAFDVVRSARLA